MIPKRVVPRMAELTAEEVSDLFRSVHHVAPILERSYGAEALNIAIQDGPASGQSVLHLHVHMLPRRIGDFARNDDIYEEIEKQKLDVAHTDFQAARSPRSLASMASEASSLRLLFPDNHPSAETTALEEE
jgi:bis(5'-adenosyl)-triphosphatase